MAHGYLGDGYGEHGDVGDDRSDDRDRRRHESEAREGAWRDRDDWRDRDRDPDRGMMFGRSDRWSNEDRWTERGGVRGRGEAFGGSSEFGDNRRSFSAHPDDHYRSWRDRHMSELDRDYADYCREREQQFHIDFDTWRQQRHASYQPLCTGMTNSGMSHDPSGQVQQETEGMTSEGDAMGAATLGTNEAPSGRTRR